MRGRESESLFHVCLVFMQSSVVQKSVVTIDLMLLSKVEKDRQCLNKLIVIKYRH